MLFYEFHQLKPDYETIVISPSTLEAVLNPTPDFMKQKDLKKQACTFWTWNIVEDIWWNMVNYWREQAYEKCRIWRQYIDANRMQFYSWKDNKLDKQFQWVYEWLESIADLFEPYSMPWKYNLRNHNWLVEINFSGYKVLLKWECDWGIDWEMLFDSKTAKTRWNEEEKWAIGCYQARFYSFIQFLSHPELQTLDFVYLIVVKNKTPKLQTLNRTVTRDEATQFVREKLKEYLTKLKNWEVSATDEALNRL